MSNTGKSKELISTIIHLLEDYYREGDYMSKGIQGEGYHKLTNEINDNLGELYLQSNKESYFWFDCSLATYNKTLTARLQKIIHDENPDKTEEELLLEDYRTFDQLISKQRVLVLPNGKLASEDYNRLLNVKVRQILNEARDKKKSYIQSKFKEIGERIAKDGDRFYREPLEINDALILSSPQQTQNFENNFDQVKPAEIHKHFKTGLVDKGHLSEHELVEYLKAAFEFETIPDTLFKIKDAPTKAIIERVFYTYYKNVAGKIHGKQKQYAALLGDYFEGYKTNTISSNFSKSVY